METKDLLLDELKNLQDELSVEGDPTKRTFLKLQQISLEYELTKERENGSESFSNILKRCFGGNRQGGSP